jgi:hypothetical protein
MVTKDTDAVSKKGRSYSFALLGGQLLPLPIERHTFMWLNREDGVLRYAIVGHVLFLAENWMC